MKPFENRNVGNGEAVIFPDPNLEVGIREAISKPTGPIRPSDLTKLTRLKLYVKQISDISPLANLTSLQDLRLAENPISDISPLANLPNLRSLDIA